MVWVTVLGAALTALATAFIPEILYTHRYVDNPFEVVGVIGGTLTTYGFIGASRFVGMTLLLLSNLAALVSLVLRLHHARGNERRQVKWFMFAAVPLTALLSLIELDMIVGNFSIDFMFHPKYPLYE